MSMKTQILNLLRSREAHRIRFTAPTRVGSVVINRTVFKTVADAIDGGKIKVSAVTTFAPGVGAEYDSVAVAGGPSGELRCPPIRGRVELGLALHECVHAWFDLTKTNVGATEEESICYVTNALYFRMTGLASTRWNAEPHATARTVANTVLRHYQHGTGGASPTVGLSEWASLVIAVGTNPTYATQTAGLIRWLPFMGSDTYTNDG